MSFEFFPPKDDAGGRALLAAIDALEPLAPDFVSVTYGATGSSRERTIEATRMIQPRTSAITVGHLTCVSQSIDELSAAVDAYAQAGVRHILAVRGDPPGGPTAPWQRHPHGLDNATELVELVKSRGDFCVGVGAFPDAHPDRKDLELDARILAAKQAAGAEFAITQLFFDADAYFRLVERAGRHGADLPIIAGIMPVTNIGQIERFAGFSGADLPAAVTDRLYAVADDPVAVREVGVQIAVELCDRLLAGGAPGLQFFTQNRSRATAEILGRLRQIEPHD